MSNLSEKLKIDDKIMKELGVKVIRRLICITDKGQLDLVVRKGENNYFLSIDSVPLEKEVNDKLMDILFKPEIPQLTTKHEILEKAKDELLKDTTFIVPKKKGRPIKKK